MRDIGFTLPSCTLRNKNTLIESMQKYIKNLDEEDEEDQEYNSVDESDMKEGDENDGR